MTFETTADVIFEPDQDSLRSVRDAVESIGPVEVGVESPSRNPAARGVGRTDGGPGGLGGGTAETILTDLRDLQEDTLIQLEDMADDLGSGDGGPTEVLTGIVGDVGGEAAGSTAETIGSVGGTAAGSALGTLTGEIIAGGLGGDSDSGEGNAGPVEIADGETPLSVERPTLAVEEPTLGVDDPSPLGVDDPSPLGVDDPSPLGVDAPTSIPVDAPESIPLSIDGDITARASATSVSTGGGGGVGGGSGSGGGEYEGPGFVESVTDTANFGANVGSSSLGALGPPGIIAGALGGGGLGAVGGAVGYGANRVDHALTGDTGAGGGGGGGRPQQIDADIRADRRSTIDVDVSGLDRLRRDIIDEVEQMHDQDIRELERELQKLEDALRSA